MSIFLAPDDVAILTGKKVKSGQIAQLRRMGIAFYINASGRPVVPKSAIDGARAIEKPQQWKPALLNHG